MNLTASNYSATEIKSLSGLVVGTTTEVLVAETASGNTLTMIQVLQEIGDLQREVASHRTALGNLTKALDDLGATSTNLSARVARLPGKWFVFVVVLVAAVLAISAAGLAPQIRNALAPWFRGYLG